MYCTHCCITNYLQPNDLKQQTLLHKLYDSEIWEWLSSQCFGSESQLRLPSSCWSESSSSHGLITVGRSVTVTHLVAGRAQRFNSKLSHGVVGSLPCLPCKPLHGLPDCPHTVESGDARGDSEHSQGGSHSWKI